MFNIFRREPRAIKISEARLFLAGKFKREIDDTSRKMEHYAGEVKLHFSEMKKIAEEMQEKQSNQYANVVKDKFCESVLSSINSIDFLGDSKAAIMASMDALQIIGELNMKEFRHLHFFKGDMEKMAQHAKILEEKLSAARKAIENSVSYKVDRIVSLVTEMEELERKTNDEEKKLAAKEDVISKLRSEIETEEKSASTLQKELASLADKDFAKSYEEELARIKARIDVEFSGMSKVFRKYLYHSELAKEQTEILKEYAKNPGKAFLGDESGAIRDVLYDILDYGKKDDIELDEKKEQKVKDLIRGIEVLAELRDKHGETERKMDMKKKETERAREPLATRLVYIAERAALLRNEAQEAEADARRLATLKKEYERDFMEKKTRAQLLLSELLDGNILLS